MKRNAWVLTLVAASVLSARAQSPAAPSSKPLTPTANPSGSNESLPGTPILPENHTAPGAVLPPPGFMNLPSSRPRHAKRKKKAAPAPLNKPESVSVNLPTAWTVDPEVALIPSREPERLSRFEVSVMPLGGLSLPRSSYAGTLDFKRSEWPGVEVAYVTPQRFLRGQEFRFSLGAELLSLVRESDVPVGFANYTAQQNLLIAYLPIGVEWKAMERPGISLSLGFDVAPAWATAYRTPVAESQSFFGLAIRARPRIEWRPIGSAVGWLLGFNASAERWTDSWQAGWAIAAGARF